ncbi:hypothetical protein ILUMI_17650 [Ignelater luminosus]|uniref:Glucose-methanol-choline oxidoreductase N-terminal domain-containing protein n=1 Tax=Ignelater luminosus TaxID=2038154 RepID=A0A8K0G7Q4_IGNLU|nr:hypothetical protein ILUMI_17650 [Ignelater luminosus]
MKNIKIMLVPCLLNFIGFTVVNSNETVDYYVNLINQETARANSYKLPTDSSEFKTINSYETSVYGSYDYIIVGAGSAGAVIANRLSEIYKNKILLLEAGGHESDFSDIPRMNIFLQGLEFNWNYNSTPQTTSCLGMFNQECAYPRGRGLGGSSIINALMYVRGNKEDYNNWYRQGNLGWSYDDVLPYFIKSENSKINGDRGYHGVNGNLNVEYHEPDSPQFKAFLEANLELGRQVVDYNGREQLGVAKTQTNTINGRRDSTGKAFLKPACDRPNLEVLTHSLVIKILINSKKEAYGVRFSHKGKLMIAKARREVIISAGSIGSPQLLMLSGIGPRDHLRNLGIPVIKSLSVGKNLQDHATYYALHFVTNYTEPVRTVQQNVEEFLNDYGPLTISGNSQGIGFFQTKLAETPGVPDIELVMVPSNSTTNFIQKAYHYNDVSYDTIWGKVNPSNTFTLFLILLHPKSRGEVKLKSKNPFAYPLINPRFLSDPKGEDIETMYQGIELVLEIVNTNAFKKLNASLLYAPLPACQENKYLSREYWYCQLRQLTFHIFHPIGTCKMGPNPEKGAVVNHQLKVHGIRNLRVADASIIPETTSGHTNAPSIMIGEKVSDMIKYGN